MPPFQYLPEIVQKYTLYFQREKKRKKSETLPKEKDLSLYWCPVGWGCRIHRLFLCRGVRTPNQCPGYDTKQSDGEVTVMLKLWAIVSIHSLLSLPGPFWLGVVAPHRVISTGWIELNCTYAKPNFWKKKCFLTLKLCTNWIVWNKTYLIYNCV